MWPRHLASYFGWLWGLACWWTIWNMIFEITNHWTRQKRSRWKVGIPRRQSGSKRGTHSDVDNERAWKLSFSSHENLLIQRAWTGAQAMHRVCRSITRNQVLRLEVVTPQVVQQQATNRRPYNEDNYFVRLDVLVNGECQAVTRNEENTVENTGVSKRNAPRSNWLNYDVGDVPIHFTPTLLFPVTPPLLQTANHFLVEGDITRWWLNTVQGVSHLMEDESAHLSICLSSGLFVVHFSASSYQSCSHHATHDSENTSKALEDLHVGDQEKWLSSMTVITFRIKSIPLRSWTSCHLPSVPENTHPSSSLTWIVFTLSWNKGRFICPSALERSPP